jgi:hypothetical protein
MAADVYFCGYDDKGNLYVDSAVASVPFELAELPKGKKTFTIIKLKGATIHFPGDVHWDGKYVTVADQQCGAYPYPTCLYQTTGAGGKIVGSTPLNGSGDVVHFWIDGNTVIGPIWAGISGYNTVPFWKYPAGGKATKTLKDGFDDPIGAAVSVAQ